MEDTVLQYYNPMSRDYHLIFADWRETIQQHGQSIDQLIRCSLGSPPMSVLDCSCGIGTQAIGLAMQGYRVHATDISPDAVSRASAEAKAAGAPVTFGVADLRTLEAQVRGTFDVVLSCDNALPHLLTDNDLSLAAHSMAAKLRDGGLLVASVRDYDRAVASRSPVLEPSFYDDPEGRRIVFQVWDWAEDGRSYVVHQLILRQIGQNWQTAHYSGHYRARLRDELGAVLTAAGFCEVRWLMPEESGYYQPVVTAHKRLAS